MRVESPSLHRRAAADRTDRPFAVLTGAIAFLVYWLTLFPGLVEMGDSPKLQYVGRLLGTPHNPGYPLYVVVSWAFSYLPLGNVAFRINLLSAIAGSLTVAIVFRGMRVLGCSRPAGMVAALALAFGGTFWSQAVRAEVYTPSALFLAWFVLALARWDAFRRRRDLLLAIGVASVALGLHLTITLIAPAALVYAIWTDRREALRPSTLLAGALLVFLGLAQYGFILVRTHQHARFLESSAHNLRQLFGVMRGSQFEGAFFAFGLHDLVFERVPLVAHFLLRELGYAGAALLIIGLVVMLRRRPKEAVFFALGGGAVILFALTYNVPDIDVFLIPSFVLGAVVVGYGLEWALPRAGRARIASAALASLLLPGANLVSNYHSNDGHGHTFDADFFAAFFAQLPPRAAIVSDLHTINWMLTYEIEVEGAGRGRDVRVIPPHASAVARHAAEGYAVYAFMRSRDELQEQGLLFAPVKMVPRRGAAFGLEALPVFRLIEANGCTAIGGDGWSDIGNLAQTAGGRLLIRLPDAARDTRVELSAPAGGMLRPRLARARGAGFILTQAEGGGRGAEKQAEGGAVGPPPVPREDGAPAGWSAIEVRLRPDQVGGAATPPAARGGPASVLLDLGRGARTLRASASAPGASVCPDPLLGRELLAEGEAAEIRTGGEDEAFFGRGWRPREEGTNWRVASGEGASVVLPLASPQRLRVTLDVLPSKTPAEMAASVRLEVNGADVGARPMTAGSRRLAWDVAASYWTAGLNDVKLISSAPGRGRRRAALAVASIRVEGVR